MDSSGFVSESGPSIWAIGHLCTQYVDTACSTEYCKFIWWGSSVRESCAALPYNLDTSSYTSNNPNAGIVISNLTGDTVFKVHS